MNLQRRVCEFTVGERFTQRSHIGNALTSIYLDVGMGTDGDYLSLAAFSSRVNSSMVLVNDCRWDSLDANEVRSSVTWTSVKQYTRMLQVEVIG